MRRVASWLSALFLCSVLSAAQMQVPPPPVGGITIWQVIRLSQSGVSDDTVIAQVRKRPHPFNLSLNQVLQLKDAHVSNPVIEAMMEETPAANKTTETVTTAPDAPQTRTENRPQADTPTAVAPPVTTPQPVPQPTARQTPAPVEKSAKVNDGKLRVYVTDRPITEVISMIQGGSYGSAHASGYANGSSASYSASAQQASHVGGITNDNRGGADPRTLEVSGDIGTECHMSTLVVTSNPDAADYILDFRRRGGTRSTFFVFGGLTGLAMSAAVKVDHAGLYRPNGDLIVAAKARTVGGAVKEVCPYLKQ